MTMEFESFPGKDPSKTKLLMPAKDKSQQFIPTQLLLRFSSNASPAVETYQRSFPAELQS